MRMVRAASAKNHAMTGEVQETRLLQIGKDNHTLALQILRLIMGIQAGGNLTLLAEFAAVNHLADQLVCLWVLVGLKSKTNGETYRHNASNDHVNAPEGILLLNNRLSIRGNAAASTLREHSQSITFHSRPR